MIFGWFGRMRSFGEKVTWLVTLTSGAAIIAVSFALAAFDYSNARRETIAGLEAQTMIVAMNIGAPLAFADPVSGREAPGVTIGTTAPRSSSGAAVMTATPLPKSIVSTPPVRATTPVGLLP